MYWLQDSTPDLRGSISTGMQFACSMAFMDPTAPHWHAIYSTPAADNYSIVEQGLRVCV
jgi:hypothetical protein